MSPQPSIHTDFDGSTATYTYCPAGDMHAGMLEQVVYAGATGSGKTTQTVSYTGASKGSGVFDLRE